MKPSLWQGRHRVLLGSATVAASIAVIAVGVPALALSAQPSSTAGRTRGSGYPPPGGIYTGFTNCPVKNPLMLLSAFKYSRKNGHARKISMPEMKQLLKVK